MRALWQSLLPLAMKMCRPIWIKGRFVPVKLGGHSVLHVMIVKSKLEAETKKNAVSA